MNEDTPSIAEKVKFWEEQDRINKELIPRVLKMHELLNGHVSNHEAASSQIAVIEARFTQRLNRVRKQAFAISGVALTIAVISIVLSLTF